MTVHFDVPRSHVKYSRLHVTNYYASQFRVEGHDFFYCMQTAIFAWQTEVTATFLELPFGAFTRFTHDQHYTVSGVRYT